MTDSSYILAIDQGTTSSRAILFNTDLHIESIAQQEFTQYFPHSGWVEHDPEDIWNSTIAMCRKAVEKAGINPSQVASIGITNQRETTVVWDRETGKTIYNAIVWQDRRTAPFCEELRNSGHEASISAKTGLLLDPYFSATKLNWILSNVEGAQSRADAGNLLFGTVDSYLIWRLTGGQKHVTDATNAARTMLYNIVDGEWDTDLLELLNIPSSMLPKVLDCAGEFGVTTDVLWPGHSIAIRGVAGDQQAATVGQACFEPGMMKSTYSIVSSKLMDKACATLCARPRW